MSSMWTSIASRTQALHTNMMKNMVVKYDRLNKSMLEVNNMLQVLCTTMMKNIVDSHDRLSKSINCKLWKGRNLFKNTAEQSYVDRLNRVVNINGYGLLVDRHQRIEDMYDVDLFKSDSYEFSYGLECAVGSTDENTYIYKGKSSMDDTAPDDDVVQYWMSRTILTTYSILESKNSNAPIIRVPGVFKNFQRAHLPLQLQKDSGQFFRDQSGFRFGDRSADVIFEAIQSTLPHYDFSDVAVITDRNIMRNLFNSRVRNCSKYKPSNDPFYAVLIGDTVIFKRCGPVTSTLKNSFGHSFEERFTYNDSADGAKATGTWVVNEMIIAGNKYIIRSEADAVMPSVKSGKKFKSDVKSVEDAKKFPRNKPLKKYMRCCDEPTDDIQICELKTRRANLPLDLGANYLQMLFGNCSHLCVGFQNNGVVKRVQVLDEETIERMLAQDHQLPCFDEIMGLMPQLHKEVMKIKDMLVEHPGRVFKIEGSASTIMSDVVSPISPRWAKKLEV